MADIRTLPPYFTPIHVNKTLTRDNFLTSYHYKPLNWYLNGNQNTWNQVPGDHRNENPLGNPNMELLNQYDSAGYVRQFYPSPTTIWNPTQGLALNTLTWLLNEADYYHNDGKKMIFCPQWFKYDGSPVWDADVLTSGYEQELFNALTALLTSTHTNSGGLGFTFANHPAISIFEPCNEMVNASTGGAYKDAYARFIRTTLQLFKQYKPACQVIIVCGTGGVGTNFGSMLKGDAVSISSLSPNGDNGTGKTLADYVKESTAALAWHFYQFNQELKSQFEADIANNAFVSKFALQEANNHLYNVLYTESKLNSDSPLFGYDISTIPIHNTESGLVPAENVSPYQGGMRWFLLDRKERFNILLRWFITTLFQTQDGSGGLGIAGLYKSDLPGIPGSSGTNGTMSNISSGLSNRIRFTAESISWIDNMSIVITAPAAGWSDLNLAANEKKRFEISVVDNNNNILELQDTVFTTVPEGIPTYTEYQTSHSAFPEEWEELISELITAPVSWGYINYPGSIYPGFCLVLSNKIYYSTENGEVRQW